MDNIKLTQTKKFLKGQLLLKQGEVSTVGFKVNKGCLKSYVLDQSGKEHILQFAPENWLVADLDSLTNKVPSLIFIEAIEDTDVSIATFSDYEDIYALEKDFIAEMAIKFRNNLIASNKRIIGLLSSTAEQRYIAFTETYPTLVQRLPLKLIAAYIGITPEYLSEIRRKIAQR